MSEVLQWEAHSIGAGLELLEGVIWFRNRKASIRDYLFSGKPNQDMAGGRKLIGLLGHDDYGKREKATQGLLELMPGIAKVLAEMLSPKELEESPYFVIWPTFQMPLSVEGVYYYSILPEGPERCKVMTGICFPKSTVERPNFEEEAQDHYIRWDIVNYEDIRACESAQRGLHSMFYRSGRYSHLEEIVHRFHNYVIDRVSGSD